MGWCMRRFSWSLTAFSFTRIRFEIVIRFSQNRPFPAFAQMCVKPRLCRRRHNLGHADLWIMPTWPGISLSQAAISPIVSA